VSVVVQLENLVKHYGRICALDGVTLTIGDGITGLLGPNGAGKSTLIKILLGLVNVTSGRGSVLGLEIGRQGRAIRSRVGYMPEDDCFFHGMTGVEMVRFSACLAGLPQLEGLRRAHEILDFCGLQQERYRAVDGYSTGMRQKVKFAAAIVHDPPLLILDEPTAGLDPEERQALLNRVHVLSRRFGKAVLLSTHILPDVQHVCDSVIVLVNGRMRVADSLANLNRTASPTIHVRVLDGSAGLADALRAQGFDTDLRPDGSLAVMGADGQIASSIWHTCRRMGVTIQSLTPAKTSLEEVFLSALKGDNGSAHP